MIEFCEHNKTAGRAVRCLGRLARELGAILVSAAAARLAELGCTEFEIMAITGHTTSKEVTRYTRAASQKTRAESALRRMSSEQTQDKSVPLSEVITPSGTKPATNSLQ